MYKISEVANMLNVEKVVIFEKLISKSKEIEPYITKEKGVTYFTDFGVEVMNALIYGGPMPIESSDSHDDDNPEKEIILEDEFISDDDIKSINDERVRIKKEIMFCRNKLIELDGQHKQLDEALRHYQNMVKEDLDWMRIAEGKVAYKMQNK